MTDVLIYWSNICVLHKQEQAYLEKITEALAAESIRLTTRFFGLGYPQRMSEYLAQPEAVMPDIIVSTDLEVFEDARIFARFRDALYPAGTWHPIKQDAAAQAVWRADALLPYVSIPLVFATRNPEACEGKGVADLAGTAIALGGINNSAVKTVHKAIWERYGQETAERLLENATVTDMPIQAFGQVRTGASEVALVPTLYALRADGQTLHARCPADGAVLIPSYIAALRGIAEAVARRVVEAIVQPEITSFFVQGGDLLCYLAGSAEHAWMGMQQQRFQCPSGEWLAEMPPERFYAAYKRIFPQAAEPVFS